MQAVPGGALKFRPNWVQKHRENRQVRDTKTREIGNQRPVCAPESSRYWTSGLRSPSIRLLQPKRFS